MRPTVDGESGEQEHLTRSARSPGRSEPFASCVRVRPGRSSWLRRRVRFDGDRLADLGVLDGLDRRLRPRDRERSRRAERRAPWLPRAWTSCQPRTLAPGQAFPAAATILRGVNDGLLDRYREHRRELPSRHPRGSGRVRVSNQDRVGRKRRARRFAPACSAQERRRGRTDRSAFNPSDPKPSHGMTSKQPTPHAGPSQADSRSGRDRGGRDRDSDRRPLPQGRARVSSEQPARARHAVRRIGPREPGCSSGLRSRSS